MDDEPVVSAQYAVTASHDFRNCSLSQFTKAKLALDSINSMLEDGRLLKCVLNGQFAAYESGTSPAIAGYPEHLLRALRTQQTTLECVQVGPPTVDSSQPEWVKITTSDWLAGTAPFNPVDIANLIGLVTHELVHTKGYTDGPTATPLLAVGENPENNFIASNQVGDCANAIHDPNRDDLSTIGALRATDMAATGEVVLAPAGANGGGTNPQQQCASNDFAVGLTGRSSSNIDALGLVCGSSTTTPQGGSGGGAFTLRCPTDQTLVGVHGRADWTLQHIGPICGTTSVVQAGNLSDLGNRSGTGGGNVNHFFRRLCPAGHAVKGVRLRTGSIVDRLQLICQRMSTPRSISVRELPKTSGTGGGEIRLETCPSRSAMFGLVSDVRTDEGVRRLAGVCTPVSTTAQNGAVTVSPPPARAHMMLGVGNPAGRNANNKWVQDECIDPSTGARGLLIGVSVQSSPWVRRIRAICVNDPNRWSRQLSTPTSSLAWRGTDWDPGAPFEVRTCPSGEFMVGARVNSGDWVDSVEVHCRRF
ncbi:MAG TPA: hypothetical protein VJV78_33135 [Polyangiales bacterium]|nr:hypothetical protein [Polyangiales bacterium]